MTIAHWLTEYSNVIKSKIIAPPSGWRMFETNLSRCYLFIVLYSISVSQDFITFVQIRTIIIIYWLMKYFNVEKSRIIAPLSGWRMFETNLSRCYLFIVLYSISVSQDFITFVQIRTMIIIY